MGGEGADQGRLASFANRDTLEAKSNGEEGELLVPTRNVNLTAELDEFVLDKVRAGRYENASEVVRAALRSLERDEREYEAKLAALGVAVDEGDASGMARGDVFQRVRSKLELAERRR